ncbi:MAG TPA: MATE family efflux transporter [Nevskiaceae bacterium]|nr:MATE family efflux transporter [Nevskiaceae bacterium]
MKDMTTGPVRGHVLRMAAFMLVSMLVQTAYSLIDMFWVARLGAQAAAAVGVASNLMFVVLALSQALGVGTVALVSQSYGRKDEASVQRWFNQSLALSVLSGLLFAAIGFGMMRAYTDFMSGDAVTAELARRFLAGFIPAMALQFSMTGLGSSLRAIGTMKPGLYAQTGSVLLNMALAPVLIFGWLGAPALGVLGGAMASLIAALASIAGLALYLRRGSTYLRVNFTQWKPDLHGWKHMLLIGLPSGLEMVVTAIYVSLIFWVIRPFGADAQAGFGIGMRLMQTGFMPAMALSFGAAAVVGQNVGARNFQRVKHTFYVSARMCGIFMLGFTVLCQLSSGAMMQLMSHDAPVIAVGADYLKYISWNYLANGLGFIAGGVFQGMGYTLPSLLASAARMSTFVASVLWLSHRPGFTLHQVWLTSIATVTLQVAIVLVLLRSELKRRLAGQTPLPATPA